MGKTVEELLAMLPPSAFRGYRDDTKFAPKLTLDERCEIKALHMKGTSVRILAAAFGLHRRTVSHIVSHSNKGYKAVEAKVMDMGEAMFCRHYITEAGMAKVLAAANAAEVKMNEPEYRDHKAQATGPDKRKSKQEGKHTNENNNQTFEVAWKEAGNTDSKGTIETSGWYYRWSHLDYWNAGGDDGMTPYDSSKDARDAGMAELSQVLD